jgi:multidrug efflux pump subunit AcrA (membrane-fusion protein)
MTFARYKYQIVALVAVILLGVIGVVLTRDDASDTNVQVTAETEADHAAESSKPAIVTLTEAAMATAQILVEPVRVGAPALVSSGLEVPAQVEFDPRRVAMISPRTDGRLERLTVVEGDRVSGGQVVALLHSREFLVAQSDLQQAARRATVLSGGADGPGANALLQAARTRLVLLGVSPSEIARLEGGGDASLYLPLAAPFAGSIVKAHVLSGQAVHAGDPVFTVADLSVVDVIAEVPERSMPMVRVGQAATVSVAAFPALPFAGRVERLRDELNPETRTVRAVIHVANTNGRLRAGMFATVRLAVASNTFPELRTPGETDRAPGLLTIPESAVVTDGDKRYVFVQTAPRTFERREVETAPLAPPGSSLVNSALVLVRGGLRAGEQIVTRGAFTLKSELAKAGLGEHGH